MKNMGINVFSKESVLIVLFLILCLINFTTYSHGQTKSQISDDGVWEINSKENVTFSSPKLVKDSDYRVVNLDSEAIGKILDKAPLEFDNETKRVVLSIPMPNGEFINLEIEESPIFTPELQEQYPDIKTYRGQGLDNRNISARLDITSQGFHAIIFTQEGTLLIDPVSKDDNIYITYWKSDVEGQVSFECGAEDHTNNQELSTNFNSLFSASPTNPSGDNLTTYRLAITATGEYTTFFGGMSNAAAQIATTINRVTGIYEREVAISFILSATNIYEDPTTDPFPTGSVVNGDLLDQNQSDLDSEVGSANYDIGHIFSQGGSGGLAGVGACNNSSKARGGTSLGNPSGDVFDVDFVSHEIGHQYSGSHTWNGDVGSCEPGQFAANSAYEPGSGTTIMAYAGICGSQNVQPNSNDYFHTRSFDQITAYRDGDGTCSVVTPTGNNIPVVDAGPDFTIPQNTPFILTSPFSSDGDGDSLTFNWEQFDLGTQDGFPMSTFTNGPLFRSRPSSSDPSRTLPILEDILAGVPTPWEVLPTVDRTMNFRVTARDNRADGGGVDYDSMVVTVSGDPFFIISPDMGDIIECGDNSDLTWNVGGGAVAPNVKATISTDNGSNFSDLINSTSNDGSEPFTVPQTLTDQGRMKLEAIDNIFFDISGPFSIEDSLDPTITAPDDIEDVECTSPDGATPSLGVAFADDICDDSLSIFNDAPDIFPIGNTTVIWSAEDDSGNIGTDVQQVEVVDTTPPDITAPDDITEECTSPEGTPVDIGIAIVEDVCDETPTVTNDAPALFPLGDTVVTWTASDDSGNENNDNQTITIEDTTPPELEVSVSPESLWPPNHKMITINANITVEDICDENPMVRLVSISSNEPDNGLGDGNTVNDIQGADFGTDDREFQLRAERSGTGSGRIYTIIYEAEDSSGNTTSKELEVVVPKSQKK